MYKPAIIVPYRDRAEHLQVFIPAIRAYLPDADIIIVEQADSKPFNRAKLLNVGFLEFPSHDYYIFHDVDKIPVRVDYSFPSRPTQLEVSEIQSNGYFGGVTMFNAWDFQYVNGFSNEFWGWGGEDNEMYRNTIRLLQVAEKPSVFQSLPHKKNGTFNYQAWNQSQRPRRKGHGLNDCKYKLQCKKENENFILLKVEL